MTDENYIKWAVAHLRGFNYGAIGTDHCSDVTCDAIEAVCKAYIAEHPADDEDPITDEWLIDEWGFYGDGADVLHRWVTDKIRLYRLKSFGNRVMYSSGHVHAVNRGEVRRMAAGFGLMKNPHRTKGK